MLYEEQDAKFKLCPLLKTSDDKLKFCQVANCMMWRWSDKEPDKGYCGLAGTPVVRPAG